jgi:hypothetical protein
VAWIRLLSLVLGSATHSFELMLSAFILGLSLGAFWIRRRMETMVRPLATLVTIQMVMGGFALLSLAFYQQSFQWTADMLAAVGRTDQGYTLYTLARYGLCLVIMLPATFWAGMTLPLITRTLFVSGAGEAAIGRVYSWNTFGSIIGAAAASLLLIPLLGLKGTLILGGVVDMLVGLFLVWLYCMALALVTLWVSLYLNELLSAFVVIGAATILCVLGALPIPAQPFVITPFPALLQPVYSSIPSLDRFAYRDFFPVFVSCAVCLAALIGVALVAIQLGPLYGIIRENSTFGEVVRAGDSKGKRWIRLRLHIQRPSEIAFFYENRSGALGRIEGLLRWGIGLLVLLVTSSAAHLAVAHFSRQVAAAGGGRSWWIYEFHVFCLTFHGVGLALAAFLFSHSKNSTYLRIPFCLGWKPEVSRLDTAAFLFFALLAAGAAFAVPLGFERYFAEPNGLTLYPTQSLSGTARQPVDFARVVEQGNAVLLVSGLVVYALQRLACLASWSKLLAFAGVAAGYAVLIVVPVIFAAIVLDAPPLRDVEPLAQIAYVAAMTSPLAVLLNLFHEFGPRFPSDASTLPFYVLHGWLLALALVTIRRRGRKLREAYLSESPRERK